MDKIRGIMVGVLATILVVLGLGAQASPVSANTSTDYNKAYKTTRTVYRTHYKFYKAPYQKGMKAKSSAKGRYKQKLAITRVAKNKYGTFYKTKYGWIKDVTFYQYVRASGPMNVKMQVAASNVGVYSKPKGLKGYKTLGSTSTLGLVGHWYTVDQRSELNTVTGYYRILANGNYYWIRGKYLAFNTAALKGHNKKIEAAIAAGMKLVGKSKYNWGGGRTSYDIRRHSFDCSSFVHYMYAKAGVRLGGASGCTTYSLIHMGKAVSASHMKRGDIFFFDDKEEGRNCHVALYLGNHLFIHDSPSADTGGVGVSSLQDPHWKSRFNYHVRRIVG